MTGAYYNEFDPYVAQWLRNLIAADLIAPGDVDERSIVEVQASDITGYTQCHFFAGIGGWSRALRLAAWPDDHPVWTGSCPCQPFSAAGKRRGTADERHLWPEFHRLIAKCRPAIVFGEQVASKDGRLWLAGVRADLEALGHAVGAADLCAAGVGAPHIRQRLFWVADADGGKSRDRQLQPGRQHGQQPQGSGASRMAVSGDTKWGSINLDRENGRDRPDGRWPQAYGESGTCGQVCGLAEAVRGGQPSYERWPGSGCEPESEGCGGLGDTEDERRRQECALTGGSGNGDRAKGTAERLGAGFWLSAEWLPCLDGARRVEPGIFPLVDGLPAAMDGLGPVSRVGALRGAGNAIIPQVAAEMIMAYVEANAMNSQAQNANAKSEQLGLAL